MEGTGPIAGAEAHSPHTTRVHRPREHRRTKNPGQFCHAFDFGFMILDPNVVAEIGKKGGKATSTANLTMDPGEMEHLFIVGFASYDKQ